MSVWIKAATGSDLDLFTLFEKTAATQPDKIAFKADGGKGRHYTFNEVRRIALDRAGGLVAEPFAELKEIGLLSANRPEWCIAYLAILAAGKTVVPIDANLKPNEIDYIISHADLKAVFVSGQFESRIAQQHPQLSMFSFEEQSSRNWLNLDGDPSSLEKPDQSTVATLIYTSGTTGDPKAVELTHRNLVANLEGIYDAIEFYDTDSFLSVLPLHHTFEATVGFLTPLTLGLTVTYARSLKSREILEDLANNETTVLIGVPLLFEKMYHSMRRGIAAAPFHRRFLLSILKALSLIGWKLGRKWGKPLFAALRRKIGLGSLRIFVSGGAAIPPQVARFFNLLGFDFLQGYGLTETAPVLSVNRQHDIKFGSVGPPLKNVEIKIFEPDSTGTGEIIARGENITPGYRDQPEKTAELLRDGWLHTGDLGRIKKGHLWITGRMKNLIVSAAGKNIYPEQIEEKLLESGYVMEAVVFGRKKTGKQGEEVRALIVPDLEQFKADFAMSPVKPDMDLIEATIKNEVAQANSQMADFKRISTWEVQVNELEKTSTKKVKRYLYK